MAKRPTTAEAAHIQRVRETQCLVCGYWPVEVHHVVGSSHHIGRLPKRHDRVVPLCQRHHAEVHAVNHRTLYQTHGHDLLAIAWRLWSGRHG